MSIAPAYGQKAMNEELSELASAQKGQRNIVLFKVARKLFSLCAAGILDEGEISRRLQDTAVSIGLTMHEINSTLGNARDAGYARPRSVSSGGHADMLKHAEMATSANFSKRQQTSARVLQYDLARFHPFAKWIADNAEKYADEGEGRAFYAGRGLTPETVHDLHLGWIPGRDHFFPAEQTGKLNGRKECIPHGACMPIYGEAGDVEVLLIRRADKSQWDQWGKFKQVGREDVPFLLGEKGRPLIVCESVLDAASVWQVRRGYYAAAALLGADKSPDARLLDYMSKARSVLVCADGDQGGLALCAMVLKARPDAVVWRPRGDGIKDLNDVLVELGEDQLGLWLDMGMAQTIKGEF